ncbi:FKBP-type peptidyl-prolyl cis-trans isomerase [uncultured Hymenobacter sp.]|uniref:FKBP-type peptidyl-prolyl cis-trans isomerase n=1 Tax=uncultured Hymenobacter sp. TaxID=170016 RepID=UPI0035CA055B
MKSPSLLVARYLTLLLAAVALLLSACKKDEDIGQRDENTIKKYVADNRLTTAQRQASGLYYVPLVTNPTAIKAQPGRTVDVLYTGQLLDGTVFDASSRHGNVPIDFTLGRGQVIQGWDEGIALMRKGEKAILLIPSALGYGAQGGGTIPPNAVLRFEVELVNVR